MDLCYCLLGWLMGSAGVTVEIATSKQMTVMLIRGSLYPTRQPAPRL